jgi:hypothetical protein
MYYGTPPIVTNGLVLNLDTQNPQSIPLDPAVNQAQSPFIFTSGYSSFNVTASNNTTINYDGTLTAGTLSTPQVNTYYARTSGYNPPIAYGKRYATSWLLKYANVTNITLNWGGIHSGNRTNFNFNLQTGVISGVSLASGENYGSYDLGNGWYQVWYTSTTPTTGSNLYYPQLYTLTSGSVFIGGIQIEMNNYATPFTTSSRTSWQDISGNNNTATLLSSSISGGIPVFPAANNRVLNFDGTGSFALVPDNLTLNSTSGTINVWFLNTGIYSTGNKSAEIVNKHIAAGSFNGYGMVLSNISSSIYVRGYIKNAVTNYSVPTGSIIFPSTWYNATLTYQTNNKLILYVNGVVVDSINVGSLTTNTQPFRIGTSNDTFWLPFNGRVAVSQIYNRALSQSEITQNYNALKSRFGLQ